MKRLPALPRFGLWASVALVSTTFSPWAMPGLPSLMGAAPTLLLVPTPLALPAVVAAPPMGVDHYELKSRSVCKLEPNSRPPFWPVGYVKSASGSSPVAAVEASPALKVILSEKDFLVTSTLVGPHSLAVINGRSYTEGESLRLPKSLGGARVWVRRIEDGVVQLEWAGRLVPVKLRQPELNKKKGDDEEDLLNNAR